MLIMKTTLKEMIFLGRVLAHHSQRKLKKRQLGKDRAQMRRSCALVKVAAGIFQNAFWEGSAVPESVQ